MPNTNPAREEPLLSIIVPVYNEAATIRLLLDRLLAVPLPMRREVIVVDDGSRDATASALDPLPPEVKLVRHDRNLGKGAAIRTGLANARGSWILVQDADMEYDPGDIPALLQPALRGGASVVYGSRIRKPDNPASYFRYYWGGRVLSWWTNLLFWSHVTDEPTGYKLFKADLLRGLNLKCTGFEFCPEATAKILRRKIPIHEVPISYHPRSIEEGKKIRWHDGVVALWTLLKHRFLP